MDPKLQLVTGCALVAFFSHTNLSLFTFTFQPQFTNMEGALPPEYYYSAASIQLDP